MRADFRKKLSNVNSTEHAVLLKSMKRLVDLSRDDMEKNFTVWDANDDVFRSLRKPDKDDRVANAQGKPGKLIVPLTFAQVMTFVSFSIMSITQNRRFFELEPIRREEAVLNEVLELLLEHDVRRNKWTSFLIQFFLDIGRFSLGVAEVCYTEEVRYMRIQQQQVVEGAFGNPSQVSTDAYVPIPFFRGNRVFPVSPYRFLPDTRLPLTRFQEGEFCGSEELWSMARLRGDGNLFNLDKIPKMTEAAYRDRRKVSRIDLGPERMSDGRINPNLSSGEGLTETGGYVKTGPVVVTKMVMDIVPKDFKDATGEDILGDEDFPLRYIVWAGNDKTIIRFEEAYFLHGQFPYICAQYIPDQHQNVNEGLADNCKQLADLITWKLNAHIAAQRNTVQSRFVVDPAGIDTKNLEGNNPYIYLKKNASQQGVERFITQLKTEDTTTQAMSDIKMLKELTEQITGWSAQMQGQYSSGRRSATQDRVVAQGAGARGKTTLGGIWDSSFEPLGRQFIVNNRQDMEFEDFVKYVGDREWPINPQTQINYTTQEVFAMFKADPITLATSEHFFVFDGSSPSEKAFLAQSLQEIFITLIENPEIMQILGYGPEQVRELFDQIYLLRGVTPARLPAPQKQAPIIALPKQNEQQSSQPGSGKATA